MRLEPAHAIHRNATVELGLDRVGSQVFDKRRIAVGKCHELVVLSEAQKALLGIVERPQLLERPQQLEDADLVRPHFMHSKRVSQRPPRRVQVAPVTEHQDRVLVLL